MTVYHGFLTYRDAEGDVCHLIHYDIPSVSALRAQILDPIQNQESLLLDSHVIPPAQIIRFEVYQSQHPYAALRLADGSSPLDQPPDLVRFLFELGIVDEVEPWIDTSVQPSPTRAEGVESSPIDRARPGTAHGELVSRLTDALQRGIPGWPQLRDGVEGQLMERHLRTRWVYYVLCGYAALGNAVLTGLVRWVELGPQPTRLTIFLRDDAVISGWLGLVSLLLGLGLITSYHLVPWRERWRGVLTFLNIGFLTMTLEANLLLMFTNPSGTPETSGWLMIFIAPYLLLMGVVAGITFTLSGGVTPISSRDAVLRYSHLTRLQGPFIIASMVSMLVGAVTTHFTLSTGYRIAYPLWFSYLLVGIVLWIVSVRLHVVAARRQLFVLPRTPLMNSYKEVTFPPLPPMGAHGAPDDGLPPLPALDPQETP